MTTVLNIKVVPGASRTEISGWLGDALKIRVAAAPEGGKANRAVEKILAESLSLSPRSVSIISGHSNAHKRVAIEGLTMQDLSQRLSE